MRQLVFILLPASQTFLVNKRFIPVIMPRGEPQNCNCLIMNLVSTIWITTLSRQLWTFIHMSLLSQIAVSNNIGFRRIGKLVLGQYFCYEQSTFLTRAKRLSLPQSWRRWRLENVFKYLIWTNSGKRHEINAPISIKFYTNI